MAGETNKWQTILLVIVITTYSITVCSSSSRHSSIYLLIYYKHQKINFCVCFIVENVLQKFCELNKVTVLLNLHKHKPTQMKWKTKYSYYLYLIKQIRLTLIKTKNYKNENIDSKNLIIKKFQQWGFLVYHLKIKTNILGFINIQEYEVNL